MFEFTFFQAGGLIAYLAFIAYIFKHSLASKRLANKTDLHLLFGSSTGLLILWTFRTGIYPGLDVHFLWLTACLLILGYRLSLISTAIALLGTTLVGKEPWHMLGINGLLGNVAPLSLSYLIYSFSFHRLPKHLFVYIFVSAFFCGAAAITLKMGLLGGYYAIEGIHSWEIVQGNYLVLIPLLLFMEGMLNGMTLVFLVIYKPAWVYTYHDKYYLNK